MWRQQQTTGLLSAGVSDTLIHTYGINIWYTTNMTGRSNPPLLLLSWIFLVLTIGLATPLYANEGASASTTAPAATTNRVIIGTSEGPPYMIKEPVGGLDIDTVKAALEHQGFQVDVEFYSLNRAMAELMAGRIDVMVPSFTTAQKGLYSGDPHILYRPTVFSLKSKNIELKSISDMGNYRIASFQGVTGYFGPELLKATQQSPAFYQHRSMSHLVDMLMNDRADLVLLDYWIFDYFYRQSHYQSQYDANDRLFERVPAVPVFNNKKLRDEYNLGLKAIHKNGIYRQIMQKFKHD